MRESIDGEHIEVVVVEKLLEGVQFPRNNEGLSGLAGKPEPDSVGTVRRDVLFDLEHILLNILENLRPSFSGVDVGAVCQVGTARYLDTHRPVCLFLSQDSAR